MIEKCLTQSDTLAISFALRVDLNGMVSGGLATCVDLHLLSKFLPLFF